MTDPRTTHLLQRSVRKLAVDLVRDTDKRRQLNADQQLAERDEQVQIELRGTAAPTPVWSTVYVPFQHSFVTAHDRRMSALERPHTSFNYELIRVSNAQTNEPELGGVVIHGAITDWATRDGHTIVGATVALCAVALTELAVALNFHAVAHMTFQGYGVPDDPQPDMEL